MATHLNTSRRRRRSPKTQAKLAARDARLMAVEAAHLAAIAAQDANMPAPIRDVLTAPRPPRAVPGVRTTGQRVDAPLPLWRTQPQPISMWR